MIEIFWTFSGFIVGLLITSVFAPPKRKDPRLPTPNGNEILHTKSGCVKFRTAEVPCDERSSSLNLAAEHK
jgi:hypothetical protein